jgi:hypothetical protein
MIRFDRTELAPYPNKSLDPMDFNAKEALKSIVRTESLKKMPKKIKKSKFVANPLDSE